MSIELLSDEPPITFYTKSPPDTTHKWEKYSDLLP